MPSNDQEPDLRAAQLELLGGILKPLDHAGDKSDPGRRWENSDNGITFHSSSGLDITIVESAFCEAGIEISRAQNGADSFLVIPDESATRITPGAMTTLEQHVGAHVLAGILNDGFTPNSDVSAQWEADAGKGGIRKPNTRVYTDSALEAIDLSREMRERMDMETSIKHRPADDGETTRYMVVISMAPDPHGQISDISNGLQAQNQVTDQAQSRGHTRQARRSAMGR